MSSGLGYFLAGALGSISSDFIVHPVDTIRARLQVRTKSVSFVSEARSIVSKEGPKGLYKGYLAVLLCGVPSNALFYTSYEFWKKTLSERLKPHPPGHSTRTDSSSVPSSNTDSDNPGHIVSLASAALANAVSTSVYCPMEVVKQQTMVHDRRNTFWVFRNIFKNKGFKGFYEGAPAAIATWTPYMCLYFLAYEQLTSWSRQVTGVPSQQSLAFPYLLLSGFASGAFSASITNPLDVVKTRIQSAGEGIAAAVKYKSTSDAISSILKNEGFRGFLRGIQGRVMWLAPASTFNIVFYELYKRLLLRKFNL